MTARPNPPADFDESPPLDDDFFARAVPATRQAHLVALAQSEATLRAALERIVRADAEGQPVGASIRAAREILAQD
jgi:hypothetical protein